jgi:triphosphatase
VRNHAAAGYSVSVMPDPQEIELKLGLCAGARDALEASPLLAGVSAQTHHEVSTYWDTQGFDLAARGFSLRVRRRGETRRQTVKRGGDRGLVATRGEWEWDITTDAPDLSLLHQVPDFPLADVPALLPMFLTDIRRTVRIVDVGGATVEAVIDVGEIRAGGRSLEVAEAELELKSGEAIALYHLARALCDAAPLAIVAESKAERGRRLALGAPAPWHKQQRLQLTHRIAARAALQDVIGEAVAHFLANVPAAADEDPNADAEGVHQARAAIRRLRAALRLFGMHDKVAERLRDRLKRAGAVLGEARDWDVFATDVLPPSADAPTLVESVAARRAAAHARVRAMLRDKPLLVLLLDLLIWTEHARLPGPTRPRLAAQLDHEARRARKRGRRVATKTTAELHALRRAVRRLRYDTEFVAGVFGGEAAKPYIKQCKRLQIALGDLGDAAMAERLLEQLPRAPHGVAGRVLGWSARVNADTAHRLPRLWKQFRAADPFWR